MNEPNIPLLTDDGSFTVFSNRVNETYHSHFGAIAESQHIFIDNGLAYASSYNHQLEILEVGFGTGLNAYLTALYALEHHLHINYLAFEPYPLDIELMETINYSKHFEAKLCFIDLHRCDWAHRHSIYANFYFEKRQEKIEQMARDIRLFDVIYFDAFSPEVQAEMWTDEMFLQMYQLLKPGGVLMTYCAKGVVKRRLIASGFKLESLPGPKGKREISRAIKL